MQWLLATAENWFLYSSINECTQTGKRLKVYHHLIMQPCPKPQNTKLKNTHSYPILPFYQKIVSIAFERPVTCTMRCLQYVYKMCIYKWKEWMCGARERIVVVMIMMMMIRHKRQRKRREGRGRCWHIGMKWWHRWSRVCHHWRGSRCNGGAWRPWGWWGVQSWTSRTSGECQRCRIHSRTCSWSPPCMWECHLGVGPWDPGLSLYQTCCISPPIFGSVPSFHFLHKIPNLFFFKTKSNSLSQNCKHYFYYLVN